jgi:spore germination protein KB
MEKKSYISPLQIILMLFTTRLLFSSSYQSALKAGNNVQDLLLSIPFAFAANILVAIPILVLLARHPGHDPVECAIKIAGRGVGTVVAVIYFLFFGAIAALTLGNYENYFTTSVIPDVRVYIVGLYLILVCLYGVLKGIESIARFGGVVAVFYIIILLSISLSLLPLSDTGLLKPILYKGTKLFMQGIVMNFNLSYQVVILAFLAPFIRQGKSAVKTYFLYSLLAFLGLVSLEYAIVTVTGAFGAKQLYPLQLLSSLSHIGFLEELDAVDMVAWILNTVITVTLTTYLAVHCLLKIGLNKHRRIVSTLCCAAVFCFSTLISRDFYGLQMMMVSALAAMILIAAVVVIPLIILVVDLIKGRVVQNAKDTQNAQNS